MPRRKQRLASDMMTAGFDAWSLYVDASTVIGLRMMKLAAGDLGADRETALMITEKVQSAIQLNVDAATGRLGATPAAATKKIMRHYKRKVGANRRRLAR